MLTIIMTGRPTTDLELKENSNGGTTYVRFNLAVNKGFGEKQKTLFFQCWLNGKEAERIVNAKVKKGSLISVTGDFDVDTYESNGEKRSTNKVNVLSWEYAATNTIKTADADSDKDKSNVSDEVDVKYAESNIDDEF